MHQPPTWMSTANENAEDQANTNEHNCKCKNTMLPVTMTTNVKKPGWVDDDNHCW
jgi:hypothetical protein